MKVTYTNEEAQQAVNLYDLAVKAGGLQVAQIAIQLTQKLQNSAKEENDPSRPE